MAKATKVLCNTDALSRAAEAITARDTSLSKNAVLNMLAAAIAGPGHDWGKLKNAPEGQYSQPGLQLDDQASTTAQGGWIFLFDERDDWAGEPALYATREDALEAVAETRISWESEDHPFETVMSALSMSDSYHFVDTETLRDEDFDGGDFLPSMITLSYVPKPQTVEKRGYSDLRALWPAVTEEQFLPLWANFSAEALAEHFSTTSQAITAKAIELGLTEDEGVDPASFDTVIIYNDGQDYVLCQREDLTATFKRFGADEKDPRIEIHALEDVNLWADFQPQAWVHDNAMSVDPQGDTSWRLVLADYERPHGNIFDYLDHLKGSVNAPRWVSDWTGPFEIKVWVEPKAAAQTK